jgi:hypothetical protein
MVTNDIVWLGGSFLMIVSKTMTREWVEVIIWTCGFIYALTNLGRRES